MLRGFQKGFTVGTNEPLPHIKISVIIPVRNEAQNIISLLNSLNGQSHSNFEVIIINDNSEDNTVSLVEHFQMNAHFPLQLLHLPKQIETISHKKAAITLGISKASGELIVCTDGDCIVKKNWLLLLNHFYQKYDAKLISGGVLIKKGKHFFDKIQALEFSSLIGIGAASMNLKTPNMCNGANLAYPKQVFEEIGGYQGVNNIASGDDEFLMHKILQRYPDKLFFIKKYEATVETKPLSSLSEFYHQRKRWASKWKYYKNIKSKLSAISIFILYFSIIVFLFLSIFQEFPPLLFLILISLKFVSEYFFLKSVNQFFKQQFEFETFTFTFIAYPFYAVWFGTVGSFGSYKWKDRDVQ